MGTKKGQVRKTARRAYEPKKKKKAKGPRRPKVTVQYGAGNSMYVDKKGSDGRTVYPWTRIGGGVKGFGSYISRPWGDEGFKFFPPKIIRRKK
jgi:hypothetical protein